MKEKSPKEQIQELLNAMGAIAEMSLNFYRATIGAGASEREAETLVRAYLAATMYGKQAGEEAEEQ